MSRRKKAGRRKFGYVRELPSGRYQASYIGADGLRRTAPRTFDTESEADDWLTLQEADLLRGDWSDPNRGKIRLSEYGDDWIEHRPGLRARTSDLYRWLFGRYIRGQLGGVYLSDLDPARIRRWHRELLDDGVSATMVAKAYRLLRAILATAVEDDELIPRNPCRIKGGGREDRAERPVLDVAQVFELADRVSRRFRALILVTTFASLRFGEVTALRRRDLDLREGTVSVRQAFTEVRGKGLVLGPPKSRAGLRTVVLPKVIMPILVEHLAEFVADNGPDTLVFTGPKGASIRRSNFNPLVGWKKAVADVGLPGLHFHDLRHTGNTLAAREGVSTKDLMARMGHDSMQAAIIYQHASLEADRGVAKKLNAHIRRARKGKGKKGA